MLFQGSNTFHNITTNILKLDLIMVFLIYIVMGMVLEIETLQWVRSDLSLLIGNCGSPHNNSYNSTSNLDI
jgi:uncharacterized membrane protein affecting hemolysin expression